MRIDDLEYEVTNKIKIIDYFLIWKVRIDDLEYEVTNKINEIGQVQYMLPSNPHP